jgi:Family of unknown function (DUF6174)
VRTALAVAAVLVAAAPASAADPAAEAERLAKARERWAAQDARDYRFRVALSCFCLHRSPVTIRVRDGKPRGTPRRLHDFDTVEELFARIEEQLDRGGGARARYAARTGVPRRFDADPLPRAVDDEYSVTVRRFRVMRGSGANARVRLALRASSVLVGASAASAALSWRAARRP